MAEKDEKKGGETLILGRYKTMEEAEKGVAELEKKLGEQGKALGDLNKVVETWKPWVEKAAPIVDWYGKTIAPNADKVKAWLDSGMAVSGAPNGSPNGTAVWDEAKDRAEATPGYEWLPPAEKRELQQDIAAYLKTQVIDPSHKEFWGQAEKFANTMAANLQNQHRSFTDVMWQTMQRAFPKEKMDEIKAWHEASLRFADPSKIDPMKLGEEFMGLTGENASLKAKVKEYEEKSLAAEKAAVPGLFGSVSPDLVTPPEKRGPMSREDRFKAVMNDVQQEHGAEGVRQLFPTLV